VNQGFHVNGCQRHSAAYTSHELPHFLDLLEYDYPGDSDLAALITEHARQHGLYGLNHRSRGLKLEYGTIIPMYLMNPDNDIRVLPVACNQYANIEEGRQYGECVRAAIEQSNSTVALLASGSLSHQFAENRVSQGYLNRNRSEFNRLVDLMVLDLWRAGRYKEFLTMLPDYAERCYGEAGMQDTAVLFGALGWTEYRGAAEILGDYFASSGTGQCNVEFSIPA
jgi:3,4-dihydroxyphenylacetate 2,3-dioxygenase